jgi:hypothetical protein
VAEQIPEHCDLCAERLDVVGTRWRQAMLAPDNEQEPIRAHAHAVCLAMAAASPSAPDTYEGFLEVLCTTWTGRRWPPGVKPVRADEPLVELLRRQRYTATESMCCEVAVHQRAERCPCWVPVYSGKQARPRRGLCLVGGVGTGKSTAAGAVVRRLVLAHGLTARWVPLGSWLVESALARRRDDVAPPTPATLAEAELLVLDDVGSSGELAGPARELLEDLVGRVYDADRLLVFTSNVPPGELGPMVGPRISSRLHALAEVIRLVGADRRRAAA